MRISFKNKNYIKFSRDEILMLLVNAENNADEELFDKCNVLHAFLFKSERELKNVKRIQYYEFVMEINSPLCEYITNKYLEYNPGQYLEHFTDKEVVNSLLHAIVSNDTRYIGILEKIVQTREYEYYDEFKKNCPSDVIDYIKKYMFYNYSLNNLEYDETSTYLVIEDNEGFYLEHIILSEQKSDVLSRNRKM